MNQDKVKQVNESAKLLKEMGKLEILIKELNMLDREKLKDPELVTSSRFSMYLSKSEVTDLIDRQIEKYKKQLETLKEKFNAL